MQWTTEQTRWLVKVLHPERTLASLPGGHAVPVETHAALLGLTPEVYGAERARLLTGARQSAQSLLAEHAPLVDALPLEKGACVVAFGDSHTADPQSWAVILRELLSARRPDVSFVINAVAAETTTHGLVRMEAVAAKPPDWVLFFMGVNDARTQGPAASKTLVDHSETARNFAEMKRRATGRRLWIAPPAVDEQRVAKHWALNNFGVRFDNANIARVGEALRQLGEPVVDLFSALGSPPSSELLMEDGLHFTLEGQQRVALEVLRGWSAS